MELKVGRRTFLKGSLSFGAFMVSFPLMKFFLYRDPESISENNPFHLTKKEMEKVLSIALSRGGEFAEIYFEYTISNNISLDEEKISYAIRGVDCGVGIRVINGERTGYAFTDEIEFKSIKECAETASLIASGVRGKQGRLRTYKPPSYYLVEISPENVAPKKKARLLYRINEFSRKFDKRITQVSASFSDISKFIIIANSEGLYVEDRQTLTRLGTSVNAIEGERRSMGYDSKSGTFGFEYFSEKVAEEISKNASEMAIRLLPAEDAPAGEFPVVIEKGYGGIFFHEAIGHSLEGDGIRKKTSVFWDKLGKRIASPIVNLCDDGSWKGGWGTVNVDDEGTEGQKTILIEKGICSNFLQDRLNAKLMKMKPTGNGRRQSFRFYPIPRMTNTYLLPGDSEPEEIIKSVDRGVYIAKIGGGNVQPTTGRFVFTVTEGYMIENGKITKPLKGIMLMGTGQEVLMNISMVGNDLLVIGGGTCGKDGQSKPVGFGNPTIKVSKLTVGGRKI